MTSRCLICDSKAVIPKDFASATATIIGALEGFLTGVNETRNCLEQESRVDDITEMVAKGVASVIAGYQDTLAFSRDMQKYQFGGYERLCLRCGARFD